MWDVYRAFLGLRNMRDLKIAVVTLLLTASLAAGCTGNSPEEDLDAKYQEGYDAGYGDAYDASYDGVAQHQYNEGWDDGWGVANTDSQAEIAEIQATVSGLEAAIALMEDQRDSLLALLSESQEFANQTNALAEAMNETIAGLHAMLAENATQVLQLQSDLVVQQDLLAEWINRAINNDFSYVNLSFADLGSADLRYADLGSADLRSADLRYANLRGAYLSNADLGAANLTNADLRYANLYRADLGAANLTNADLINANLYLANLQGAQLHLVSWDNTVCPDGTNSDDNGNTCEDNL